MEKFKIAFSRCCSVLLWVVLILFALGILNKWVLLATFLLGVFDNFYRRKIGKALDRWAAMFKRIAYTLDMLGCVTIFDWTWFLWKKKDGFQFGATGITISFVLKKNFDNGTLFFLGKPLYYIIKFFDKKHFEDSKYIIENKIVQLQSVRYKTAA